MKLVRLLMFNAFTTQYLKRSNSFYLFPTRRLKSAGIDFMFLVAVFFPLMLPFVLYCMITAANVTLVQHASIISAVPFTCFTFVLLNKDFFNGRSVAKRVFGYQVVQANTDKPAEPFKCMLRNITLIIWPVEVIVSLISPGRRLGDFLAGTVVVVSPSEEPKTILIDMENTKWNPGIKKMVWIAIAFSVLFSVLTVVLQFLI